MPCLTVTPVKIVETKSFSSFAYLFACGRCLRLWSKIRWKKINENFNRFWFSIQFECCWCSLDTFHCYLYFTLFCLLSLSLSTYVSFSILFLSLRAIALWFHFIYASMSFKYYTPYMHINAHMLAPNTECCVFVWTCMYARIFLHLSLRPTHTFIMNYTRLM